MTTQTTIRFFSLRLLRVGVCTLLVGGLLAGSWVPATAQPMRPPNTSATNAETVARLADQLTATVDAELFDALPQITNLAYRTSDLDLTPAVPALIVIYQSHPETSYRYAALGALHAIGDETGMQAVRDGVFLEPSLRVQYVALAATLAYFGPQAFGSDAEAVALANNVLARRNAAIRFGMTRPDAPIASGNQ